MNSSISRKLALISVSDKTDIDKIAKELINNKLRHTFNRWNSKNF